MNPTQERWLPVPGYEGFYEVSDHGRVRSVDRVVVAGSGERKFAGRVLRLGTNRHGYMLVALRKPGIQKSKRAHRLVLEAFVGPCPEGMAACHENGDKLDNRLSNLRWDTTSSNLYDAVRHGTHHWASKTHCPQGHPYSPDNTIREANGRRCRECHRRHNRESQRRRLQP